MRVGGRRDGPHHRHRAHAAGQHLGQPGLVNATDGDQRVVTQQLGIGAQPAWALGCGGHALKRGRKDCAHGDVTRAGRIGAQHFGIAMGAQAQAQAGGLDIAQTGGVQVFLPQVSAVGAAVGSHLPMVVDEQQRRRATHGLHRRCHLALDRRRVIRLEAQL